MTTILTPVAELKVGDMFCIGAAIYTYVSLFAVNLGMTTLTSSDLRVIFPDGVPVIVPDEPKEVRCVVTVDEDGTPRVDGEICVSVGDWLDILLENSKTYDLVLTEREDSK